MLRAVTLASALLLSCATAPIGPPLAPEDALSAPMTRGAPGVPLPRNPQLLAVLHAPPTFDIAETSMGLNAGLVTLTLTNTGSSAVDLGEVHLSFTMRRGGITLPCAPEAPDRASDAGTLAPGTSFTATSSLNCWTPLVGEYAASVFVGFGRGPRSAGDDSAGVLRFTVLDPSDHGAREAPTHPGLFALVGGALRAPPVSELEPLDRGYHVSIVVVNAGPRILELPAMLVSLRAYLGGAATPCTSEAFVRRVPALAVGVVRVVPVPVSCVRDRAGDYVVVAHITFDGEGEASGFDVGHVGVRVTRDLGVIMPLR